MENPNKEEARPSLQAPQLAVPDAESARRVVSRWLRTNIGDALYLVGAVRVGTNPIVGIDLRPVEGIFAYHAVVVVGITPEQVLVHDPRHRKGPSSIGLNTFQAPWKAADREAAIIAAEPMSLAI